VIQCNDTGEAYQTFYNKFTDIFRTTIPIKQVCNDSYKKQSSTPWLTKGILTSIDNKNKMYKNLRVNGDISLELKYKKFKNKLGNLLRQTEKNYYKSLLDKDKNNLSKMWKTLNQVINWKKKTLQNTTFKHNNRIICNDDEIASHFNNFFLNVAKDLGNKIPVNATDPCSHMSINLNISLFLNPTNEDEILKIISNLKNASCGYDGINMKLIKTVKYEILAPFVHICNLSFTQGKMPDILKIAKVIPIHKKEDKQLFSNYRPISVLPAFSKIIERLVYKRIIKFLDLNKILYKYQFGFRKGRSTDLALHAMVDKYYEAIERNEFMVGTFIDLSRAFDSISHTILLRKLKYYGIRGIAHDWIKDYLTNRKQYVIYNSSKSSMGNVTIGVPQGSILGPLLFLLYVNEINNVSDKLCCILFADDTNIFTTGKSLKEIQTILNDELSLINSWFQANKLSINISKTNFMIMSSTGKRYNSNDCKILIDGQVIECVAQTKFLGVIIDNKLSWKFHMDHISSKISKGIGILIRARQLLYGESLQTLYNTLIKPNFIYCITIWGNSYKSNLHQLHLLQKKIIRILTRSEFYAHTEPLLNKRKMMNIYKMHEYFVGIFVFKSLNNLLPEQFCNIFSHNFNARHSLNLRPVYCRRKSCQFSIKLTGSNIWNKFSNDIKIAKSIFIFKKLLKDELLKSNQ
jgi:Skp family chaperone for outer membrane proteins